MFRTVGERTSVRIAERDRRRRVYRSVAEGFLVPAPAAEHRPETRVKVAAKKRAFQFKIDVPLVVGESAC